MTPNRGNLKERIRNSKELNSHERRIALYGAKMSFGIRFTLFQRIDERDEY